MGTWFSVAFPYQLWEVLVTMQYGNGEEWTHLALKIGNLHKTPENVLKVYVAVYLLSSPYYSGNFPFVLVSDNV